MATRTYIALARRRAAWVSLVATLLGVGVVPALHLAVHAIEAHEHGHEHDDDRRGHRHRPAARPARHAHAAPEHGHRHVGVGHHVQRVDPRDDAPPSAPPERPRQRQHHHPGDGGDERDPTQHGRGAPEHIDALLIAAAATLLPPRPTTFTPLHPAPPSTGRVLPVVVRPHAIRGPPHAAHVDVNAA